jgi:hypothetical protein
MKLSDNFTLAEFTRSAKAQSLGIENQPTQEHIDNLILLCTHVLEPIRTLIDAPIQITSGYRSDALNKAVGGARKSQHNVGEAADFITNKNLLDVARLIVDSPIQFDQIIAEDWNGKTIKWIHISYDSSSNRRQVLTMFREKGHIKYFSGLPQAPQVNK